jgi:Mg-chelatase subunit ChlD
MAPVPRFVGQAPFIAGGTIHLPVDRATADAGLAWRWYRAAAAHAAAHLAFSPAVFEAEGLGPIPRALLGVLEDARVEVLAGRELPGLRRLWCGMHTVTPDDGAGVEALLLRLARALADPGYDDGHPWVEKGRRLFFVDVEARIMAPGLPTQLRRAATLLGHDIGQMRLQFNARLYRPGPDYRDDLRWMWPAPEDSLPEAGTPEPAQGCPGDDAPDAVPPAPPQPRRYPEWDRRISRLRHDWCAVIEHSTAAPTGAPLAEPEPADAAVHAALARVLSQRSARREGRPRSSHEGEHFDPDALVRAGISQRARRASEVRPYRSLDASRARGRVTIVIDQSASSAQGWGGARRSMLDASCRVAAIATTELEACGRPTAVWGFCSNGRERVAVELVKRHADAFDAGAQARLAGLRSGHSTRLGAALRHATLDLARAGCADRPQVVVICDGEPWDIDIHEPRYLEEDARHAVAEAARQGVRVCCMVLDAAGMPAARRMFGARNIGMLSALDRLPRLVRALEL